MSAANSIENIESSVTLDITEWPSAAGQAAPPKAFANDPIVPRFVFTTMRASSVVELMRDAQWWTASSASVEGFIFYYRAKPADVRLVGGWKRIGEAEAARFDVAAIGDRRISLFQAKAYPPSPARRMTPEKRALLSELEKFARKLAR